MPTHYFSEIPSDIAAINDYRHYAQQNLNAQTWAYIDGGGADEHTLKRNLSVYSNIKLLNRVLVDVSADNTQLELSMALCGYASLDEINADCLWQP